MKTIDSHLHVWDLDRAEYPWLGPQHAPVDISLGVDDVRADLRLCGVDGVILVQAADNTEDTETMFAVADRAPEVVGVVAWVPLDAPDRTHRRVRELKTDPRFVGVRALIHDMADPDWILGPGPAGGLDVLASEGIPFDYVTADPMALRHVPTICARHPGLRLVIDHLGKPPVAGTPGQLQQWRDLIAPAAEQPGVYAKVSGLYSSEDLAAWTTPDLRPIIDVAYELFGPDRLMLGSDWPISVLAGGYRRVWTALTHIVDKWHHDERDAIRGGTAIACYGLRDPDVGVS